MSEFLVNVFSEVRNDEIHLYSSIIIFLFIFIHYYIPLIQNFIRYDQKGIFLRIFSQNKLGVKFKMMLLYYYKCDDADDDDEEDVDDDKIFNFLIIVIIIAFVIYSRKLEQLYGLWCRLKL